MHSILITAIALMSGCSGSGSGSGTADADVDWCDPPTYEAWSLTRGSDGSPTPVTSLYAGSATAEPAQVVVEPDDYLNSIERWWGPKSYDTSSNVDTGTYYLDNCCITVEEDGCPCGMQQATDANFSVTSMLVNGAQTAATLDVDATFNDRPAVCINEDATMVVMTFQSGGQPFGTLSMAGESAGIFNAGDDGLWLHLELFGASTPITYDNTEWTQGQITVALATGTFEGTINSLIGTKDDGTRVELQATLGATR